MGKRGHRLGMVLLVCALPLMGVAQDRNEGAFRDRMPRPDAAEENARRLLDDLRDARDVLPEITDRRIRDRLETLLRRAESRAQDLRQDLASYRRGGNRDEVTREAFERMLVLVRNEAFDQKKTTQIKALCRDNYFTSEQARQFVQLYTFDNYRVEAAVALYPRLVDRGNFFRVLDVFTFDNYRDAVRKRVGL